MNIALCGLSGSGKSTLGRRVAGALGLGFIDLDAQLEASLGMSIPEMFERHGEAWFREREAEAVAALPAGGHCIVALGGGAILRPQSVAALREKGRILYLDRPVERILSDIRYEGRPLLKNGGEALRRLDAERRPLYTAAADVVLPNTGSRKGAEAALTACIQGLLAEGLAVIGTPLGHSLSPPLHRAVLAARGLEVPYSAIEVPRGALAAFVAGARAGGGLAGFNVTLPHKKDMLPLLDEADAEALAAGAVNTVAIREGRLHGYNTDMEGLHLALKAAGSGFAGRSVLLLGTGGVAGPVARKAVLEGARALHIAGRRPEAAAAIAEGLAGLGCPVTAGGFTPQALGEAAAGRDLLLQATPLGMQGFGEGFESLSFLDALPPGAFVYDLVYAPPETALTKRAAVLGLAAETGLSMLIWQAILAQQHFYTPPFNQNAAFRAAKDTLQGVQTA